LIGFHHDFSAAEYHADPAPEPSLSSSVARILLDQSPRHAWLAHPRLNPEKPADEPSRPKEIGSAVHKLILGRGSGTHVIEATSYQSTAAKEARANAVAAGKIPILVDDLATAEGCAAACAEQMAKIEGCAGFSSAPSEVVAIAKDETGAWLRAMMDKFEEHERGAVIWDVKTTGQSAAPQAIGRKIADMGYEIQSALYERVAVTLKPELAGRITFRWVFIETEPPHLLTVAELDATGLEIGRKKVAAAIALWNRCRETGIWPGYAARIIRAEYPIYAERSWLEREINDEQLQQEGLDPFLMRAPWRPQKPNKNSLGVIAS
jgi:hypothetical protein